jgi:tetratricopeptide (TPR) repeat protein/class 3 adenylate cyclase
VTDRAHSSGEQRRPRAMSAERWERVQRVLAAAMDCDSEARGAVLDRECGGDADVRRDVESLLEAQRDAGRVDRLLAGLAPAISRARSSMLGWEEGESVGRYRILETLGSGAMGVVYKGLDERLGRHVALKFLPRHLVERPESKRRFLLEARAAAALDHPNICTIHEIGETADGQLFIAMALYNGETLQARLERGPLPCDDAIAVALQVARGLQQAHEHGIVHRDVKPSNVMLLSDGTVKVLDFGVAKVDDATITDGETVPGTIAYMSPEHAIGRRGDHRADVWSLGVVLYEMLTGSRPFRGDDRRALIDAILTRDPEPIGAWRADLPETLDTVVRHAMAKREDDRYASMAAMAADLAALAERSGSSGAVGSAGSWSSQRAPRADEPAAIAAGAERRWAVVVVATVSDYGALVERLSPGEIETLVGALRNAAAEIVQRHGGVVNQAIGDEIVSLFGVPVAHEDDVLRAVRAALELRQRARDVSAPFAHALVTPLRVQCGVHVGLLVAQRLTDTARRYALSGAPAQVAARLASVAGADQVLVSPECHRLVARFVESQSGAPLTIQANGPSVSPFVILGESAHQTRLEAAERADLTPYTGRDAELATLQGHVQQAHSGQGRVTTVVGEAGAGKSRLLFELRERVAQTGVKILQGRCRAPGRVAPYVPFVEVLHDALSLRGPAPNEYTADDVIARARAIDAALEPFVPVYLHLLSMESEAAPLPRHLQGEHLRAALPEALTAIVVALAHRATTLVLLEDWHWADEASREALRRLLEVVDSHALMIVVTSRPEPGALAGGADAAARIQLTPLAGEATAAIMRATLHVDRVSDALAARVHERTGGNPFFLEQVCRTLIEERAVTIRDGEAVAASGVEVLPLPHTVQAVIRARLDRLDQDSRDVLRVASVIGREFSRDLLGEVLGPGTNPTPALERLKSSGLIQQTTVLPEPAYRFRHVLTQEVAYDSLLERQRRSLHGVVGRTIERRDANPGSDLAPLLAHHFAHAEAWREAVHYGLRAAEREAALTQFADALTTLERVRGWIAHLPDDDARTDALVGLLLHQERLCETLGLRGRQQQLVEELIALLAPRGASANLAQAYLRQGDVATLLKRFDAAERALSTALRLSRELGEAGIESHTLRSIGLLRWHQGRHADALPVARSALAITRASGDELMVAADLVNIGMILKSMEDYRGALASLEEALAIPALGETPSKLLYTLHTLANIHRSIGDVDRALVCLHRCDEIALANLLPLPQAFHLTSIAHIYLQQGRIDEALSTYRRAVELSQRARHADGQAQSMRALGDVLFGLGRDDEALPYIRQAAQLFAQLEDREAEAEMVARTAAILERLALPAEAAEAWQAVAPLRRAMGDAQGELDALEGVARTTRLRGATPDAAVAAFQAALTLATTLGARPREVALHNTLGILEWQRERYLEALRHYEAALRLVRADDDNDHRGNRAPEGLLLNSLGVTLSRLHRHDEARTTLEESVALNRARGERLLEAHALAALGDVWRASGRPNIAATCFGQSLSLRRTLGDRTGEGWMLLRIAETLAATGEAAKAREIATDAMAIGEALADTRLTAACTPIVHGRVVPKE